MDEAAPKDAAPKKQPTHRVYSVRGEGENAEWTELGAVWPHSDGKDFDVVVKVVPVGGFNGRLTCRAIEPKA
jgi:hypothetical protein